MKATTLKFAYAISIALAIPALLIDLLLAVNLINPFTYLFLGDFSCATTRRNPCMFGWPAAVELACGHCRFMGREF